MERSADVLEGPPTPEPADRPRVIRRRTIALYDPSPPPVAAAPVERQGRRVWVGEVPYELVGEPPAPGVCLRDDFEIPAARAAQPYLDRATLCDGLVFLSTLPDIRKHACVAQVLGLERHVRACLPAARIHHVASDAPEWWTEVDEYHPDTTAGGYCLALAEPASAEVFRTVFGVGVVGSHRVAHGLFAMLHGVILASDVPAQQFGTPEVDRFVARVESVLALCRARVNP
jgi:hypothetical protein